ncbi:MAG: aldehyde ferredoxin oxidoreductase N-terminal domain-containing protein, partial [Candidatus Hadarchaeum sp.]|uniref:aldehyde ferredoxin oxidoreductase N-terminal domain-containing protein n=1 Tax=Candidatus Hadarchaeum sp. TaxID=2883567 RepID=UPI003D0FC3FE
MTAPKERPICTNALVDLTERTVEYFPTPPEIIEKFLGGRGLNMYYLHKYIKPGCDPLSPDNVLIIGTGLLTGYLVPNSGRHSVTCKSPETGIIGDANIGGFFGPELRFAGIDRLIITGRAASPVYLYVENGRIEIRDAAPYWGLT